MMIKTSLCGLTAEEILNHSGSCQTHSIAIAIANSIYKRKLKDIMAFPGLSKKIKEELNNIFEAGIYDPAASWKSSDGTMKFLFRNEQGQEFETVLLRDDKRTTVCVSSQAGCRMGCPFCATGNYGFNGNLSVRDILVQILGLPGVKDVTHVVFMGMGEPMDNPDNVIKACRILSAEWGLAISTSKITVSTVGITYGVERFLRESDCNITLSLYSPFPEERNRMVPAETKYPAHEIIELMKTHVSHKRRMSVAYIMIMETNDTDAHLEGLKTLLHSSDIRVNLLPYHSFSGNEKISSTEERMQYFKHELVISGISASIRKSKGIDVSAACGLLASELKRH